MFNTNLNHILNALILSKFKSDYDIIQARLQKINDQLYNELVSTSNLIIRKGSFKALKDFNKRNDKF